MDAPYDLATAYHEAGHAVVALALERPVDKVSIVPGKEYLGACHFRKGVTRPSMDLVEREILISLAGMAAQARHTGEYDVRGARRDLSVVRKLALDRVGERQIERFERRMLGKVENLLAEESHWAAIELLVAELMKTGTLSGRAARHLFDRAVAAE
jgi:ATP-dependent Zn protease